MQGFPPAGQSQNQTAWKGIIRWILFDYLAIDQCGYHLFHAYIPLEHPFKRMAGPSQCPLFTMVGNILKRH
jgi:hypothetical protein